MNYKFHFILSISYLTILQVLVQAEDEDCRPLSVPSLDVTEDLVLLWTSRANENCTISYYLVRVRSRGVTTAYTVEGMSMDVSFLPTCEDAQFTVIPVSSNNIEGSFHMMQLKMPVPPDANVSIDYLRVQHQEGDRFLLTWQLEEEWKHCTNRFRVVIYDENDDRVDGAYVQITYALLQGLVPCAKYTFSVRAIHSLTKEGPISLIRYSTPNRRISPPSLQSLVLRATSVDLRWQLESYTSNRCEVSSIIVDASPYFTVAYPVRDNPERSIISTRVASLQDDTIYFLNITVINTAGPSLPFLTAVQTLPSN